jgi:probable rRNA maturation factor
MISVQTAEEYTLPDLPGVEGVLQRAAQEALRQAHAPDGGLSIVLAGDDQLQELNRQYLGNDAPTDVLSFPSSDATDGGTDPGGIDPDTGDRYLGDILISVPRAQAQAGGHPLEEELQLLVVHGVLHLLGYDHASPAEKECMWAVQAETMRRLGCSITGPASED